MKRNSMVGLCCCLLLCAMAVNAKVVEQKKLLRNVSVVVDAGHGGMDSGAKCEGVKESDINLKIARVVKRELQKEGAKVILTRTNTKDLASKHANNRKREDLHQRLQIMNRASVDYVISIHQNAYSDARVHGANVYYKKEESSVFAKELANQWKKYKQEELRVKEGDFFLLKHCEHPAVLLECGFITNEMDRNTMQNRTEQKRIGRILVKTIENMQKNKKV